MTSQRNNRICVTGCDYFGGHELARHLLNNQRRELENCRLVCAGRHVERMRDLERQGAEVVQMNPEDKQQMEEIFRNCDCVILEPIPDQNRVDNTRRMLEAMKRSNVKHAILISCAGADANEKLRHLHEYCEIEKEFKNCGFNCHCIVRTEFTQNWFHAWSYPVEDKGQFPLSTGSDRKFAPIRIEDVCCAVKDILRGDESGSAIVNVVGSNRHNKQTYTLTGPEALNGHKIVEELNRAVQGQGRVTFQDVDRNQMERILRALRDRARPQACDEDEDPRRHFEGQPTEVQVQTILDYFDYVKSGKADRTTDDLRKITGRDGQRLESFFRDHANEFRPNRQ